MSSSRFYLLAALAVMFFAPAARAGGPALLALNVPEAAPVTKVAQELKAPATAQAQARVTPAGYTDFDVFSSVNDPLYREGAKEMLKQGLKRDEQAAPKSQAGPQLRDAPVSRGLKPARVLKPLKMKRPVHADPVKAKDAL